MTVRIAGQPQARGMIFIHSTPAALCPHIEWALGAVLGGPQHWDWSNQPAERGAMRAELPWTGPSGTAATIASRLGEFERIRFEATEEASVGAEGHRFSYTPTLGPFRATTGTHGDIMIGEDRLKGAIAEDALGGTSLVQAVEELLGGPWDDELDVFRHASEDAPVRWLHQVV